MKTKKINNILNDCLNDFDKSEREFKKQYNKELKEVKKGNIKAVVLYNQYKEPRYYLPIQAKKLYKFYIERGDIILKDISKEQFKQLEQLKNKRIKLQKKEWNLIREFLK